MKARSYILLLLLVLGVVIPHSYSYAAEKALILGVFPRHSAKATMHDFQPLADYLAKALNRPVILETTADFSSFWKGVSASRYDIVHFNQYHYLRSHQKSGYKVIAMNEESGQSTIAGAIVVKKSKGYKPLTELKGSKIIFGGGPKAMMSYIVPTYLLKKAGLNRNDYIGVFAKTPINALLAVCYGQAAAAGVGDRVLEESALQAKCDTSRLTYLAVSEKLAHLPWAVKGSLPKTIQDNIQFLLVKLKDTAQGRSILKDIGLTNLIRATDNDYDKHREIVSYVMSEKN